MTEIDIVFSLAIFITLLFGVSSQIIKLRKLQIKYHIITYNDILPTTIIHNSPIIFQYSKMDSLARWVSDFPSQKKRFQHELDRYTKIRWKLIYAMMHYAIAFFLYKAIPFFTSTDKISIIFLIGNVIIFLIYTIFIIGEGGKMKHYHDRMLEHLSQYKETRLGIEKVFLDIDKRLGELPIQLYRLNILEGIRKEFWEYFKGQPQKIKLKNTFTHLDSSQFMAFNLIFPLVNENKNNFLAKISGLDKWEDESHGFNRVLDIEEQNCFDFWMQAKNGHEIFYTIKFIEEHFDKGDEEEQCFRLHSIYKPVLGNILENKALDSDLFYEYFQIYRSLYYLIDRSGGENKKIVCFILPKQNSRLQNQLESALHYLKKEYRESVKVLFLEDVVKKFEESKFVYYKAFREKYFI